MKHRLQESLDAPHEQQEQTLSSTTLNNDSGATTKDAAQNNVPSKPSPHTFQAELPEEVDPVPDIASFVSEQALYVPDSFAPQQEFASTAGNYHSSFANNPQYPMASDASLITQPLITTPGGMQLSALLGGEKPIEFRPSFTPGTVAQGRLRPGQSSIITNRTHRSNSPIPFLPPSIGSSYSHGNASYGRDVMFGFDFSGFTPIIAPPPSTSSNGTQEQQASIPSPMYTFSSQQMDAFESMTSRNNDTRRSTTPDPPFGPRTKKPGEEQVVAKANKTKKKQARLTQRSQQMDATVVMTMNVTTQPCKCPKNQCVKLYCECFHRGQICDPSECICVKCLNTAAESTPKGVRTKRVKEILARKGIDAFKVKPKKTGVGCSCKKSR